MNFIQKTGFVWACSCLLLCSIGWAQTAGNEVNYKPTLGQMGKDVMWLPTSMTKTCCMTWVQETV